MNDSIKISKIVIISRKKKTLFFGGWGFGAGVCGSGLVCWGEEGFLIIIRRRRIWLMYALVVR